VSVQSFSLFSEVFIQRIREGLRNATIVTKGNQWASFLYENYQYDVEDIWKGLFRSQLLISVRAASLHSASLWLIQNPGIQAHIHISQFRLSRSPRNSLRERPHPWHDERHHPLPSLCCYSGASHFISISAGPCVADILLAKVCFALSSSPVFSKTDLVTDSETFYTSVIEAFSKPAEKEEVDSLVEWWNRYPLLVS
jgi:hypothetical protein